MKSELINKMTPEAVERLALLEFMVSEVRKDSTAVAPSIQPKAWCVPEVGQMLRLVHQSTGCASLIVGKTYPCVGLSFAELPDLEPFDISKMSGDPYYHARRLSLHVFLADENKMQYSVPVSYTEPA